GKYELVDGRLVHMSPTGARPGQVAVVIAFHLMLYQKETGHGIAFGDNVGFIVNLPRRRSFSPDAAYAYGVAIDTDDFVAGAPIFAVEVRSKGDYGRAMDAEYAAKRADYFAAGTRIVWDVSPRAHHREISFRFTRYPHGVPRGRYRRCGACASWLARRG
ncbi:MAG TPA: Uma2 family endonuclease, partial [Thermomicrobiales bacterium]